MDFAADTFPRCTFQEQNTIEHPLRNNALEKQVPNVTGGKTSCCICCMTCKSLHTPPPRNSLAQADSILTFFFFCDHLTSWIHRFKWLAALSAFSWSSMPAATVGNNSRFGVSTLQGTHLASLTLKRQQMLKHVCSPQPWARSRRLGSGLSPASLDP